MDAQDTSQDATRDADTGTQDKPEKPKLQLEVQIDKPSACQRHISVTISPDDVRRYFDEACTELMPKASVPGFRAGRAPRKLVEKQFRKDLSEQVKSSLLLDAMTQVTDERDFSAISEPDFDYTAVEVPAEGPMKFEFDIEVRPEFDLPNWKGLKLERPVRAITARDIDEEIQRVLSAEGIMEDATGPVALDDLIEVTMVFFKDGVELGRLEHETVSVRPTLSFHDGVMTGFADAVVGAMEGDRREGTVAISHDAVDEKLRGQDVRVEIQIHGIQRVGSINITPEVLEMLSMKSEQELRDTIESRLQRQVAYHQEQHIRRQITAELTKDAGWDLPPELLRRQAKRELDRAVLELRRSGFTEDDVRARRNELRQNSLASTERALKEHFILERIAEEEKIDADPEDYDVEFQLIANQGGLPVRAVRAYIERHGMGDAMRNQIIERKVLALITKHATFTDKPLEIQRPQIEAVEYSIGGSETAIPEAKYGGDQESLKQPSDYT